MADAVTMDKIVSLCKRRGFVFPSSEIYGGLGSSYDYGHYGVLLKDNIKQRWMSAMVQERDDIVALDSSIILHPEVWKASGHVGGFSDPLVDCKFCKKRYRADHLEDAQCGQRPSKRPGETSDCDLTEARQFNLMFETRVGAMEETGVPVYLRPETAQGIFINFKNVAGIARRKPPFGIAQVGKSFRNEITPGNFIFRTLEFEQMEMEFFVPPGEAEEWYRYWVDERYAWHRRYGIRESHLRIRPHDADELSHYSSGTSDLEYLFPIGWSELEGIANRGDFDLTAHTGASGTKLEWVEQDGSRYTPHVIEPALGVNRSMLAFLVDAYDEEIVAERERTVLRLHPQLAPVKAAVLPLIGKSEDMSGRARKLYEELRQVISVEYDDGGQIGRRYRRHDEIGTPYALTIDDQTLEDDTITIRERDSLAQERISIARAREHVLDRLAEAVELAQGRRGLDWRALSAPASAPSPGRPGRKPDLGVQAVHVARVEKPLGLRERPTVDGESDELDAQAATTELLEHVDVREVRHGVTVGDDACEPHLSAVARVQPDDAGGRRDELVDQVAIAAAGPVRGREERVDGDPIDATHGRHRARIRRRAGAPCRLSCPAAATSAPVPSRAWEGSGSCSAWRCRLQRRTWS